MSCALAARSPHVSPHKISPQQMDEDTPSTSSMGRPHESSPAQLVSSLLPIQPSPILSATVLLEASSAAQSSLLSSVPSATSTPATTTISPPKIITELSHRPNLPSTSALNGENHRNENGEGQRFIRRSIAARRSDAERAQAQAQAEGQRKSLRNKGEIVDANYVDVADFKQPRPVNPPIGLPRRAFHPPQTTSEQDKQIERLKIHMVGPKGAKNRMMSSSVHDFDEGAKRSEMERARRRLSAAIHIGPEFQAKFPELDQFVEPPQSMRDAEPDRDQLIWRDRDGQSVPVQELDDAWTAIRRHCGGIIPMDSMLHRLMLSHHSVDEMLINIEKELYEFLPASMDPLSEGERREFERHLRRTGHACAKKFRMMQDKFLKNHWLGEIVAYYYETKHRGCPTEEYNLCTCRALDPEERYHVSRVECNNCTQEFWPGRRKCKLCPPCALYFKRTHSTIHRPIRTPITLEEQGIVKKWREVEERLGVHKTLSQILAIMEDQRQREIRRSAGGQNGDEIIPKAPIPNKKRRLSSDEIARLSEKKRIITQENCPFLHPQMKSIRAGILVDFNAEETIKTVQGIQKYGTKWGTIACLVGREPHEVEQFYHKYKGKYRLDLINQPPTPPKRVDAPRSSSTSPDVQVNSRKRPSIPGDSTYYSTNSSMVLAKSPRKTRSTANTSSESITMPII
ncbi:unnamed protein product, partial [Mesorhabditis belari]|uniref:ELM2 domain-containing protein n=1 Tax=Mesorhabditis belari TaxID=2138241 RepID=A0AAF3FG04_9BILA